MSHASYDVHALHFAPHNAALRASLASHIASHLRRFAPHREYIRTSSELKIYHLKKFLGLKLQFPEFHDLQIILISNGKGVVLSESLTLDAIRTTLLNGATEEFVLHFRIEAAVN